MARFYLYKNYSPQQLNQGKNTADKWAQKAIRSFQSVYPVRDEPTIYVCGSLFSDRSITPYLSRKTRSRQFFTPNEAKATLFFGKAGSAFNVNEEFVMLHMNQSISRCRLGLASRIWHDMAKLYLIQLEGNSDRFRKYCEINDEKFLRSTSLIYEYRSDEFYMRYDHCYRTADQATFLQQLGYWLWLEFFCHVTSLRMKQAVGYYNMQDKVKNEFRDNFDMTFWIYVQTALIIPSYESSEMLANHFAILYADPLLDDYRKALAEGAIWFTIPGYHKEHIHDADYDISSISYQPEECRDLLLTMKSMLESQIEKNDVANVSDEWLRTLGKAFYDWWHAQNKAEWEKYEHSPKPEKINANRPRE